MIKCFPLPALSFLSVGMFMLFPLAGWTGQDMSQVAQAYGKARAMIPAQLDGLIVCEGEEFQPAATGGWKAKPFGENYYAATFANAFLSRKAFLGAPEQCEESRATIQVKIPEAGTYLALVRYETAYRFETRFRLRIEQNGEPRLDRLYGARENLKIWAFHRKLRTEVVWDWGAVENIVWEGHDAFVELQAGPATITLVAEKQPEPAARRNVDLVMLTTDIAQVNHRIENEGYLPLDGMLTQSGDVWLRVKNPGPAKLTFQGGTAIGAGRGNWQQHSPYWVPLRNWEAPSIAVVPGQTSRWIEVGGTMDSLADGQWHWTGDGPYEAEFGLMGADGNIEARARFTGDGDLTLAADADTRYRRRLRTQDEILYELLDFLKAQSNRGKTPEQTLIYGRTFAPLDEGKHGAAVDEFKKLFNLTNPEPDDAPGRGYIDVRSVETDELAAYCDQRLGGAEPGDIAVVSLGDEIQLSRPETNGNNSGFHDWLASRGVSGEGMGDYDPSPDFRETNPTLFYWSKRYLNQFGIQAIKERTDILRRHLPNAAIGANYSPHYLQEHLYLGEVHKWVSVFREEAMTLPWSEDYIWQIPVASPQINGINLDLFRAGLRGKPHRRILYYVMPHMPNNTPNQWRRLFCGALAHGAKIIHLFEFRPVQVAYSENHVTGPDMYAESPRAFRRRLAGDHGPRSGQRPGHVLFVSPRPQLLQARHPKASG